MERTVPAVNKPKQVKNLDEQNDTGKLRPFENCVSDFFSALENKKTYTELYDILKKSIGDIGEKQGFKRRLTKLKKMCYNKR